MSSSLPTASALLRQGLADCRFTAAVAHVATAAEDLLIEAVGCLDPAAPARQTRPDSIFDVASLTKLFVAALTLRAVEMDAVGLETRVSAVVPAFRGGARRDVMLRHLLTHTSGLPASFDIYSTGEWRQGVDVVLARLYQTDLEAQPGQTLRYSCLGYVLLGHALERALGAPLDQLFASHLAGPAGWRDIGFRPAPALRPRIAVTEYTRPRRGAMAPGVVHDGTAFALDGVAGNAGLFATAAAITDLGRQTLLAWRDASEFPVSAAALRQMSTVAVEQGGMRRGLGWHFNHGGVYDSGAPFSRAAVGHTGFTGTSLWVDPARQVVVTLLTNRVFGGEGKAGGLRFNTWRAAYHRAVLADLRAADLRAVDGVVA